MDDKKFEEREEISLLLILSTLSNLFSKIGRGIASLYKLAIQNIALMMGFVVVGSGIGIGVGFLIPPIYKSEALIDIYNKEIRNDFIESIIEELDLIVEHKNYKLLEQKLSFKEGTAKKIKSISFNHFNHEINVDSITYGLPFVISIRVYDNAILEETDEAILHYLENNKLFLKQKDIRKTKLKQLISQLDNEVIQLDSLKRLLEHNMYPKGEKNGFIFGEPIDPLNTYTEAIESFEKKLEFQRQYDLSDNFYLVKSFSPRIKRDNFGPKKIGLIGAIFGLVIALFISNRKSNKRI